MKKLLLVASLALLSVQGAWAADKMLADRHVERGVKCESCHTTMPPKAVNTQGCLKCHLSYEKLAARTDKNDINPHDSHLENLDCGACHHGHKKPVLACDECHEFTNIKVPSPIDHSFLLGDWPKGKRKPHINSRSCAAF